MELGIGAIWGIKRTYKVYRASKNHTEVDLFADSYELLYTIYYNILSYSILSYILYYMILYCTVPYCTVLYCTVLYCTVLY